MNAGGKRLGSTPLEGCSKSRKSLRVFCQTISGKAYAHDKRTYRERSALKGRVFKIASKSYAFFAYSIDAFDYQVRRKVFNRPFLNMAVSSILQPFFEVEVNSSVLVG